MAREASVRASPPHHHPQGQLLGTRKGLLSVTIENSVRVVLPIQAVWLPPHCVHGTRSHGPFDGWTVYIAESACARLPQEPRVIGTSGLLIAAVQRATTWPVGPRSTADARIAEVILDEISETNPESFVLPLPRDARLLRVAQALINNPADERSLHEWAAFAAISERTLSRRFVEETSLSFTHWRQHARVLRSLEMLASGTSVTHIALDLGYSTASAFIALFKRILGKSPASYCTELGFGRISPTASASAEFTRG